MATFTGIQRIITAINNQLAKLSISSSALTTPTYGGSDDEVTAISLPKDTFYNLGFAEQGTVAADFGTGGTETELDSGVVIEKGTGFSLTATFLTIPTLLNIKALKEGVWDLFIQDPTIDTVDAASYTGESVGAMTAGSNLFVIREVGITGGMSKAFGKEVLKVTLNFKRSTMQHITEDIGEGVTITLS